MDDPVIQLCITHDLTIKEVFDRANDGNPFTARDQYECYCATGEISPEALRYCASFMTPKE